MDTIVEWNYMRFVFRDGVWLSLNWAMPGMHGCAMERPIPESIIFKIEKHLAKQVVQEIPVVKIAKVEAIKQKEEKPKLVEVKVESKQKLVRRSKSGGIKLF